uniref:Uncharacterized protein n=1 Tax=Arundo donax TaxID=35708 RepID=A0A0A9C6I5_ARUDO
MILFGEGIENKVHNLKFTEPFR